jgi:hypothetical protein
MLDVPYMGLMSKGLIFIGGEGFLEDSAEAQSAHSSASQAALLEFLSHQSQSRPQVQSPCPCGLAVILHSCGGDLG